MLKWLFYSGCNITIKVNPFHWRFGYLRDIDEMWETDVFQIDLLPITIRFWFDDGSW
jgi:hypothetical protein